MKTDATTLVETIQPFLQDSARPSALIVEAAHVSLPVTGMNHCWSRANAIFADQVSGKLIRAYQRQVRIINTLLINDLGTKQVNAPDQIVDPIYSDLRFLSKKSLNVISERTMRNRAAKALKESSTNNALDNRVFANAAGMGSCPVPIANLTEKGIMIPRCSSIMASFVEQTMRLAKQRLHEDPNPHVTLLSFAQHEHEFAQTEAGIDYFINSNPDTPLSALVVHWDEEIRDLAVFGTKH